MTTSAGSGTGSTPVPEQPVGLISVSLIPAVRGDLQRLQNRTGLSKTDVVNRAISLYEFLEAQLHDGHDLMVRDNRTGETRVIRFR